MSRKLLIFIILMASLSLAGIIYVQLYYIRTAILQNEMSFDKKVNDALRTFVDKLDQKRTVEIIHEEVKSKRNKSKPGLKSPFPYEKDSVKYITFTDSMLNRMVFISELENTTVDIRVIDSVSTNLNDFGFKKHTIKTVSKRGGSQIIQHSWSNEEDTFVFVSPDGFHANINISGDSSGFYSFKKERFISKSNRVRDYIQKMDHESHDKVKLFRQELNLLILDSILKVSFKENGIELPFEFKLFQEFNQSNKYYRTPGYDSLIDQKKYAINLFPNDIIPKNDKVELYFPNRKEHLLSSLSLLLPLSLLFSFIILIAFTLSILMVLRQKKISDIKTDFINNMTHEFKTPIATISLAADTITNTKVISDQAKIQQFIKIIKDENKRMNTQVERILQMALLERKELDLKAEWVDIHRLINNIVQNIDVHVRQLNGNIALRLTAIRTEVFIDEVHITNVINNLLDNAIKYSIQVPVIKLSTSQLDDGIMISVEDRGIGMNKEALTKIFDKFYRVSKGNIHNVKGFGLGLSYVKAIVEAHNGRITVKSEPGKGSRFDIFLPQNVKENGRSV